VKILIIGSAGFLGANLVRRCLAEPGAEVTAMDSLDPHLHASTANLRSVWEKIRFVRGDLRDETLLAEIVQGQQIIFNCARKPRTHYPSNTRCSTPTSTVLGNLKLLEAVRLLNRDATVVYTSSSTVIGKAQHTLVDEDHRSGHWRFTFREQGCSRKVLPHISHDSRP